MRRPPGTDPVPRPVPGAPGRDHAAPRCLGRCPGGDRGGPAAAVDPREQPALGLVDYRSGELRRLRGEFTEAEDAYHRARRWGLSAQPGLALLWLAMGKTREADVAIRQALAEGEEAGGRARVLAAHVEIALALGDATAARTSADELGEIAAGFASPLLDAMAGQARGFGPARRGRRCRCRRRAPLDVGGVAGARGALRGGPNEGSDRFGQAGAGRRDIRPHGAGSRRVGLPSTRRRP